MLTSPFLITTVTTAASTTSDNNLSEQNQSPHSYEEQLVEPSMPQYSKYDKPCVRPYLAGAGLFVNAKIGDLLGCAGVGVLGGVLIRVGAYNP